jgi:hypothetical protein
MVSPGTAGDGNAGPWRLVSVDGRERLARHLFVKDVTYQRERQAALRDREDKRIDREAWLTQADTILAVINGKEG